MCVRANGEEDDEEDDDEELGDRTSLGLFGIRFIRDAGN